MKKLLTVVFTMLFAGSLAFAQATSGTPGAADKASPKLESKDTTGKKGAKTTSKAHKGGKKSKKGSSSAPTTTTPK